jgi:hypothetical protein
MLQQEVDEWVKHGNPKAAAVDAMIRWWWWGIELISRRSI